MIRQPVYDRPALFIWCGPVSGAEIKTVKWLIPTDVLVVGQGVGDSNLIGSTAFSNLGASLQSPKLEHLITSRGMDPNHYGVFGIGSFSAGHGLVNQLLLDPDTLGTVSCLGAFDSYYGNQTTPKQGYLSLGQRAVSSDALMLMTSSDSADPVVGTSWQDEQALIAALGLERGKIDGRFGTGVKRPDDLLQKGACTAAHWKAYTHVQHATVIAPAAIGRILAPWMAGQRDAQMSAAVKFAVGIGACLAGLGAYKIWQKHIHSGASR